MTGAPAWSKKVCSTCKEPKLINLFGKDKATKDGRRYDCRQCHGQKVKLSHHGRSETDGIVHPAVALLRKMPGVLALRLNSGKAKGLNGGYVELCPKGTADIVAICMGQAFFFEAKKPGEKLSPEQREFSDRAVDSGARFFVITEARQAAETIAQYKNREI